MLGNQLLIAETDSEGRVVCVWRRGPDERAARPLSPAALRLADFASAEICGASPDAVRQWLHAGASRAGAGRFGA